MQRMRYLRWKMVSLARRAVALPPSGNWILTTGYWDDNAYWDDNSYWID